MLNKLPLCVLKGTHPQIRSKLFQRAFSECYFHNIIALYFLLYMCKMDFIGAV